MTSGDRQARTVRTPEIALDLAMATREADKTRSQIIEAELNSTSSAQIATIDQSNQFRPNRLRGCAVALASVSFLSATALGVNLFVEAVTAESEPINPYAHCTDEITEAPTYYSRVGGNELDGFYQGIHGPSCLPVGAETVPVSHTASN
jgi:hypothetical protein